MERIAEDTSGGGAGDAAAVERVRRRMLHPLRMRVFMAAKLPLALFAGLRIRELTTRRCVVTVPFGWRTTNPFRSTYFAAQAMAAEMATGALGLMAAEAASAPVSSLIVGMTASFEKKAIATASFTCEQGDRLFAAVRQTLDTDEPATAEVDAVGRMPDGTVVARFTFTWSFRRRPGAG